MVTVEVGRSYSPSGISTILTYIGALNGAGRPNKIIWALFPVAEHWGPRAQSRAQRKTRVRLVMAALWMRLKDTVVFHSFALPLLLWLQGESEGYSVVCDFLIPSQRRYVKILKEAQNSESREATQRKKMLLCAEPAERKWVVKFGKSKQTLLHHLDYITPGLISCVFQLLLVVRPTKWPPFLPSSHLPSLAYRLTGCQSFSFWRLLHQRQQWQRKKKPPSVWSGG